MRTTTDAIYRRGEDPLCGIQVLGAYGQDESHEAMHDRSEIVARAAIESSRRGDGRFLEGSVEITLTTRPLTITEVMAKATKAWTEGMRPFGTGGD